VADIGGHRSAEHHLELREPEDEAVGLVDQDEIDVVTELLGQPSGELQSSESCTKHHDAHRRTLEGGRGRVSPEFARISGHCGATAPEEGSHGNG
jgi:hypothetical protein